ncbi:dihydrofolate reductase family protein [Streptomyces chrestomyceticus]|uniref:dihydrofolate reductase family protein n=1 Tax=Streptomyces chrestomyceticus TaxID=68185 RepID=UPI003793629F
MGKLVHSAITSLDGYVADARGSFAWAAPDEEVHGFVNGLMRSCGTYLFGRRMYETMAVWDAVDAREEPSPAVRDFAALWRGADKIVHSATLESVTTGRTRLERGFDPAAVRRLKASAGRDLAVGGPGPAAQAIRAGLVDEYHLFLTPVVVGGGTPYFPDGVRLDLELLEERRFGNGMVHLRHRPAA